MVKSSRNVINIFLFIALLYVVLMLDSFLPIDLRAFGIRPRVLEGLIGILVAPLIHSNAMHLASNAVPLMVLMGITFIFYSGEAKRSLLFICIGGGLLLWLFGRSVVHVGASGLIYGFAAFLVTKGFVEKSFKTLFIAITVVLLYGGMIYGLFPARPHVSWEGHLLYAISGVMRAFLSKTKSQNS